MLKVVGTEAVEDEADGRSLLDEIAREGARRMLVVALETEVAAYLEAHRDKRDGDGHALVVRNGKGRTRRITLGAGTIPVSAPRVNDRRTDPEGARRRFTRRILPPYVRRSPKVTEVLPVLSTGDFHNVAACLRPSSRWVTGRSAFGRPYPTCGRRPARSGIGSTSSATSWTSSQGGFNLA